MRNAKKIAGTLALVGLLGTGSVAFAQTSTTTTGTTTTTVPGTPNTGAGGDTAVNLALLGASALIAAGGAAYLARKQSLA